MPKTIWDIGLCRTPDCPTLGFPAHRKPDWPSYWREVGWPGSSDPQRVPIFSGTLPAGSEVTVVRELDVLSEDPRVARVLVSSSEGEFVTTSRCIDPAEVRGELLDPQGETFAKVTNVEVFDGIGKSPGWVRFKSPNPIPRTVQPYTLDASGELLRINIERPGGGDQEVRATIVGRH